MFAGVRTEADEQAVGQLHPGITPLRLDVTRCVLVGACMRELLFHVSLKATTTSAFRLT